LREGDWVSKILFCLTKPYSVNGFGDSGMNKILYAGR